MTVNILILLLSLLGTTLTVAGQENNRSCTVTEENNAWDWDSRYIGEPGWRCVKRNREVCLAAGLWCSGYSSWCDNGEDERCETREDGYCHNTDIGEKGVSCRRYGRQGCVLGSALCDGTRSCENGEDEQQCSTKIEGGETFCYHTVAGEKKRGAWCDGKCYDKKKKLWCNGKCVDNNAAWRCNGNTDCNDTGDDEKDCPWITNLTAYATFFGTLGVVLIIYLVYWGIAHCRGDDKEETSDIETGPGQAQVSRYKVIDEFVTEIKRKYVTRENNTVSRLLANVVPWNRVDVENSENLISIKYSEIHRKEGYVKKLLKCLKIFVTDLDVMHQVTKDIIAEEERIHGDSHQALKCLRVTCGSNEDIERLLSFRDGPGVVKKIKKFFDKRLDSIFNPGNLDCYKSFKRNVKYVTKFSIAIMKVCLFLWDTIKDLILWGILLNNKKDDIDNTLLWLFFSSIFVAQAMVGIHITLNVKKIFPGELNKCQTVVLVILMILLAPFTPSIVMFKATWYATKISQIIAEARNDSSCKPSQVLEKVEEIEVKQLEHQKIYAASRMIESTLETGLQLSITITIIITTDVLINKQDLSSRTSIFVISNIIYSVIMITSAVIGYIKVNKRGSIDLSSSIMLGIVYLLQLSASIGSLVLAFCFATYQTKLPEIFYCLIAILTIKWIIQGIFIFFKPFKVDASVSDKLLHILVNTFVTVPFRDLQDERQRSKTSEIFWGMVVNSTAFSAVILSSGLLYNGYDREVYIGLSPLPVVLYLLSGLFLYLYYRMLHHWREVFDTRISFCCLPETVGCSCQLLLELLQRTSSIFCCCFFYLNWWLVWCDSCGINHFTWVNCCSDEPVEIPGTRQHHNVTETSPGREEPVTDGTEDIEMGIRPTIQTTERHRTVTESQTEAVVHRQEKKNRREENDVGDVEEIGPLIEATESPEDDIEMGLRPTMQTSRRHTEESRTQAVIHRQKNTPITESTEKCCICC